MAQRKQLSWTELRVGVFVLIGLVMLFLGALLLKISRRLNAARL